MKPSICHYSLHRRWKEENWTPDRLAQEVRDLGLEAIDFHAGLLGGSEGAADAIKAALAAHGLTLSGLSLSNDFNQEDAHRFKAQVNEVKEWIRVAAEVEAPVSRIFGGHLPREERADEALRARNAQRILDGLGQVVREAETHGVTLALENHGGLPCTGEEQVDVIQTINSPNLRATVDVGNYMDGGQEGVVGTRLAAPVAAYVHFKDMKKVPGDSRPWGWGIEAAVLGQGDVDLPACLDALRDTGYDGFIALEYECKTVDERTGVPQSIEYMKSIMEGF